MQIKSVCIFVYADEFCSLFLWRISNGHVSALDIDTEEKLEYTADHKTATSTPGSTKPNKKRETLHKVSLESWVLD